MFSGEPQATACVRASPWSPAPAWASAARPAMALRPAGATVGVHYHRAKPCPRGAGRVAALGGIAILLQGDLSVEQDATRVVDELIAQAGRLDILFNNAGSPIRMSKIEDCPTDLWRCAFRR